MVSDASVEAGPDATMTFTISLGRITLTALTVDYRTVDGTATAGTDYTSVSGTLRFAIGEQSKTVTVQVMENGREEEDETFTLQLSDASVGYINSGKATGTITSPESTSNSPATGRPSVTGTAQMGETLTVDTTGITDDDGLDNVSYSYQWVRSDGTTDADITGATEPTYTLVSADQGKTIKVKVSFTDDEDNAETLTSAATASVGAAPVLLTVSLTSRPASHNGSDTFTFDLRFSEEPKPGFSYKTLRDHAFTVTGGSVKRAGRMNQPSNISWRITIQPDGNGNVTAVLPVTTDCEAVGAVCTGDGRKLSSGLSVVIPGPAQNKPATGAPTISGTAQVGQLLTADTSGIADADGLDDVSYSYQWIRNDGTSDADISGATSGTYTLVTDDQGNAIKVKVSFTDDADNQETLTSAATATVAAKPNSAATGAPTISGTVEVDQTLTADTSGISDSDGLTNVSYSYQWLADDADISGATGNTYVPTTSEVGKVIKVRVSFTDDEGNSESLTSAATGAVSPAIQQQKAPNTPATGAPTISGTAQVGQTLTANTSDIADSDGLNNIFYSYQWVRNDNSTDTDIVGATGSTYTLVSADEGMTIKVKVSFTDNQGNAESLTSDPTATVAAKPNTAARGAPTISGTAQVGQTLTADTSGISDDDGLGNASYSYQWMRNEGSTDTDISGATDSTYTLTDADQGKAIKVKVSFTDDEGHTEELTSGATDTTAPAADEESPVWSASMTTASLWVGQGYGSILGMQAGSLTTTSFEIDDVEYTVNLIEADGWIYIGFDREMPVEFTLEVDGKRLESGDATFTSYGYSEVYWWQDAQMTWSEGDTVELKLNSSS